VSALIPALYILAALAAIAVVATRRPALQVFVFSFLGLVEALLFLALRAPDVALAQLAVGSVILPLMILVTLARMNRSQR